MSDDPMESMRIGDLRLMVDYVAHTNAYRRFEARVLQAELDPVGAANARYGGSGQRRSLPILDPIDDPAHGPMPVHPADLEPFVQQEILSDRGPRGIDEPRVIEEEFLQLEALGLEAPEVPLDEQPPRFPNVDPIPQLDEPCPLPGATTASGSEIAWGIAAPPDASLRPRYYHPPSPVHRNLILMLPGGAGKAANVHRQSMWMAQAGFRVLTLDWNASGITASTECRFDENGERRTDLTDEELNACLIEVREHKNHNPDDGVVTSLVEALLYLASTRPDEHWGAFLTAGLDGEPHGQPHVAFHPYWARIVLAGYSEGANQTAYNLRQFPVYGALMVSGGGDFGRVEAQPPLGPDSLASWMVPLVEDDRRVGMYNHEEGAEAAFLVGWDVDGVPDTQSIATPDEPFYDSFRDANRLCHSCDMDLVGPNCPEPSVEPTEPTCDPHQSVISDDSRLKPAWMYMACRAGRVG